MKSANTYEEAHIHVTQMRSAIVGVVDAVTNSYADRCRYFGSKLEENLTKMLNLTREVSLNLDTHAETQKEE